MNNQSSGSENGQGGSAQNERAQQIRLDIADRVAKYLTAKGVPERNHAGTVGSITSVSALATRRKLKGETSWSAEDLALIALHYGDPISAIFNVQWQACSLEGGGQALAARADIGKRIETPTEGQLVARRSGHAWQLLAYKTVATSDEFFEVKEAELVTRYEKLRVAVLDDDEAVAEMIALALQDHGYVVNPYSAERDLSENIDQHEAFIVDYILGPQQTAAQVIGKIRASKPHALILLLTGQARESLDADIARLMSLYDAELLEKPVRAPILASAIQRWMNKQRMSAR